MMAFTEHTGTQINKPIITHRDQAALAQAENVKVLVAYDEN